MVRGGEISTKHKFKQSRSKDNNGSDDSDEDYVVSDEENEVSACSEEEEYCSSLDGYPSEASDRFVERKLRTKAKKVNNRSKKKKMPKRHCVSFKDEEEDEDDDDIDDKDYDENEDEEEEFTEGKLIARGGFSSARKNGVKISQKRRRVGLKEVDEDENEDENEDEDEEGEDKDYGEDEDEEFTEGKLKVRGSFSSARKNRVKISQKRRKVGHKEDDLEENEDDDDEDEAENEEEDEEFSGVKSKERGGFSSMQKNGVKPSQKRRIVRHEEEDDDEEFTPSNNEEDENEDEDEDEEITEEGKLMSRGRLSGVEKNGVKPSQKRRRVGHEEEDDDEEFTPSNNEDEEDDDNDDEDDEDDDDFTAEEDESLDEELPRVKRKKKTYRKSSKRVSHKTSVRGRKRRKRSMASKKPKLPKRKKSRKPHGSRRKVRSDDDGEGLLSSRERGEELKRGPKKRRFVVDSDSDFAPSARYDDNYEYTVSEEEREQVREAKEFCRSKTMPEKVEAVLQVERKPKGRKGKEKVVEEEEKRPEVVKRVCGICLSEEEKRRVRGTINCCEHYFCFTCIVEWSKVESRCPLCKQRFDTITKRARSSSAVGDPKLVIVEVPERDQVYQPTEEELRSYLYPYEDVICSECHLGGHDHLMLLCDECDSSAHTFCVGLGHEVPEGSWFCRDCKPFELESPNSHSQTHSLSSDERPRNNNAPPPTNSTTGFEGFDLNSVTPVSGLPSPRNQFGGFQATTALAGAGAGGASTVSGRIRLRHQIHHCLSERPDRPEATNQRESSEFFDERFRENHLTRAQETDSLLLNLSNPTTGSSVFVNGGVALWPRLEERNSLPDHEQHLWQCNGGRQEVNFHAAKEQLQLMVKAHLKNLSRGTDLAQSKLEEITKCSTQTILVACELELRNINEVSSVSVSQPPTCDHIELMAVSKPSLVRGCCSSCFDSFVFDIVKKILDAKLSEERRWLCLNLSL